MQTRSGCAVPGGWAGIAAKRRKGRQPLVRSEATQAVLQSGTELAKGRVISKDGQLYRVVQTVTPQAHQEPGGEGMLAVYRPIDRKHAGTLEDPIPWVYGMDCLAGMYYSYEGAVYRVADGGDMVPCVWAPDTPGLWQWEIVG